jgi:hypothetical protein
MINLSIDFMEFVIFGFGFAIIFVLEEILWILKHPKKSVKEND